ncbi:hypothetical protein ABID14_001647 [Peptoniphilus olsenii]|uniref:Lantibiotic n=1 Tax=Peptoniphilus olsenii TaxID=411570 RepID=A0ABV2JB43_9FIRM
MDLNDFELDLNISKDNDNVKPSGTGTVSVVTSIVVSSYLQGCSGECYSVACTTEKWKCPSPPPETGSCACTMR